MQTLTVVEANDVGNDIDLGHRVLGIAALPHPFHFEIQEEAFGDGIDAPMSRNVCCSRQIHEYEWIKFSDDISFRTALNFLV